MVLATARTTSFEPASVGQLKKLYTTSCLDVISWSNSSISTTLSIFELTELFHKQDKKTDQA